MITATHGILASSIAQFDADAMAFFTATGITDATIRTAVNTLVKDLKAYGIWSKLKAIYPMVGGTAGTHKYNLKNPADTNAAFRLNFLGGWTHSSNGAMPNGTNAYATTFFNPSTDVTISSFSFGFYSRTNNLSGVQVEIGSYTLGTDATAQLAAYAGGFAYCQPNSQGNVFTTPQTRSDGFYLGSRTDSSNHYFQRNATQTIRTEINKAPSHALYIGARNSTGTTQYYSSKELAFALIGDGLTTTNGTDLYTIIQSFQTSLSRQV